MNSEHGVMMQTSCFRLLLAERSALASAAVCPVTQHFYMTFSCSMLVAKMGSEGRIEKKKVTKKVTLGEFPVFSRGKQSGKTKQTDRKSFLTSTRGLSSERRGKGEREGRRRREGMREARKRGRGRLKSLS